MGHPPSREKKRPLRSGDPRLRSAQEKAVSTDSPGNAEPVQAASRAVALEELLSEVFACEREWRLMDRIDLEIRIRTQRLPRRLDRE
jgi:hypothetical protein